MFHLYANILLNLIVKKYFNDHGCLLILTDSEFDCVSEIPSVKIKVVNGSMDSSLIFHHYGCQGIVIYSEDAKQIFAEFEAQIRLTTERFNRRRFLIVANNSEDDFFDLRELDFVSDLLLVSPKNTRDTSFELKTHRYVGVTRSNKPLLLDRWFSNNQTFLLGTDLYPDKFKNQYGRALRLACFTYEPYSIIGKSTGEHHGSELTIAVQFAQRYNMTPVPIVKELEYWGKIFPNWTGTGILGSLVEDKADIGLTAMTMWEKNYEYFDFSKPTVRTGVTCLVPVAKLSINWNAPFLSYSIKLWDSVTLVLLLSIIILSLILLCYNHSTTMSDRNLQKVEGIAYFAKMASKIVIKPLLLQPLGKNEIPLEMASKLMVALMLMLSVFLTSTYSSGLAMVLTFPKYINIVNTVQDLATSGLEWAAIDEAFIAPIQNAEEPDLVTIVSRFQVRSEEELKRLLASGDFAFTAVRLPFETFVVGTYVGRHLIRNYRLMTEDLYYANCVMVSRKNSILLPSLDSFLLQAFETGLISKWQSRAMEIFTDFQVQRVLRFFAHHRPQKQVVKLEWGHVKAAFAILALGHCISFIVFVVELMK